VGALLAGVFARAEPISSHPAGQVLVEQGEDAFAERTGFSFIK